MTTKTPLAAARAELPRRAAAPAEDSGIFKRALRQHLDGIVYRARCGLEWHFEYVAGSCRELTGYAAEDLLHDREVHLELLIYPDDRLWVQEARRSALERRHAYDLEYRIVGADGLLRWVRDRGAASGADPSRAGCAEGVIQDITPRKLSERAAQEAERSFRALFDFAIEGIFRTTTDGRYLAANPALARIYGFSSAQELMSSLRDIRQQLYVQSTRREEFMRQIRARGSVSGFESQVYRRDGSVIWISENARAVYDADEELLYYEGTVEDITERKLYEARLERQANYDALTGLANRALFNDRLEQAVLAATVHRTELAVVFIDLDRFKFINDSLGHPIGDRLLQTVAERMRSRLRECDTVARFGGDEFVALINGHSGANAARALVESLIQEVARPWSIEQGTFEVACSVGVALFPGDGEDAASLLRNADSAMYRAKELGGGGCQFFTPEINEQLTERIELHRGLSLALELQQLELHYQPRVALEDGEIVGAEALLRWHLPGRGMVPPDRFIPIAEETGLILPVGQWVIEQACRQIRMWREQGLSPPPVSVNVAVAQMQQHDFARAVARTTDALGIEPHALELELTESQVMHDAEQLLATLRELNRLGFALSIDDFGAGYSSLSYLKRFAVDRLKVDRSFIRDLKEGSEDALIVRAVIALGHNLGLKVVAEGVETEEQARFLRANGCDEAQGYYYCRPVSADRFAQLLRGDASRANARP